MNDLLEDIEPTYIPRAVVINLSPAEGVILDQLAVLLKLDRLQVVPELIRRAAPSQNGHGYEAVCSGCGLPFKSARRPLPNKRRYCDKCRASGEPAAQRARDFRKRRSQEAQ